MFSIGSLNTGGWRQLSRISSKVTVVAVLVLLCIGADYYAHFVLHTEIVFTHLFYLPIVVTGFWWGRRAIWIAILLGAWFMASSVLAGLDAPNIPQFLRFGMLIVVSVVVGTLREQSLKTESVLRETRDYLDSLIQHSNVPIVVLDRQGRITLFNTAFEHLTGYGADEMLGQLSEALIPEESREEALQKINEALAAGEHWEALEIPIRCADGRVAICLWNSSNIYTPDGKTLLATIAQGQDITQRKRAEEALEERTKELQEAQEQLIVKEKLASVGQLAAGVAHEINNPLGTILLFSDIMCKELPPDDSRRGDLQMIMNETTRCKTIVSDLLNFARQNEVLAQSTDVNTLLCETVEEIKIQPIFEQVQTILRLDPTLPKIQADPAQLKEIFINIMTNAAEAMKGGGSLTITTEPTADEIIKIAFQDTGCGIPKENLSKIFTPFFTTKPIGKGTGLGLAIVYGIIKMHRGQIYVESEVGVGSTFTITLPIKLPIISSGTTEAFRTEQPSNALPR